MKIKYLTILLILLLSFTNFPAGGLKVGISSRNITPNPLLPISGGVGIPKHANIKWGELSARALVIVNDENKIAIVSIDNLGVPKIIGDRIRSLVSSIKPENILIGASHTHSAPDIYGFTDEKGNTGADLNYIDQMIELTAEAINEAADNVVSVYMKAAVSEAKGKIAYNEYAPELYDPRCGVIQFTSANSNSVIATLVNYAIHPEIVGNDQGVCSPDLIGPLYERIEEKAGGTAIFMNSAIGGMVTADNRIGNGDEKNDWKECIRIGYLLADESLRIISDAGLQKEPKVNISSKEFEIPVESKLMKEILKHTILDYKLSNINTVRTRMNLLNIGTAQIITIPGEAMPNLGFYIKRKMKTNHPFLFGLTNDAYGYILSKEDFNSFKTYNYITRTSLGEKTGEIIVDQALELIKSNPASEL